MKTLSVKENFQIPGTDVLLEEGDEITLLEGEFTVTTNRGTPVTFNGHKATDMRAQRIVMDFMNDLSVALNKDGGISLYQVTVTLE